MRPHWFKGLVLSLAVIALVGTTLTAQGRDPLAGTWRLNVAKSMFPPGAMPPQSGTRVFEDLGNGFIQVTNNGMNAAGNRTGNQFIFKRDGKEYAIAALTAQPVTTLTKIAFTVKSMNPFNVEYTTKVDGKVTGTAVETLSADGKVYTVTVKGMNQQGQPTTTVTVYEKQ
jgi:hypothetical protein